MLSERHFFMIVKIFIYTFFGLWLFLEPFYVYAVELSISENGLDSKNEINIQNTNLTTATQINDASIKNNILIKANTGSNLINQSSGAIEIKTGDVNITQKISNVANINSIADNCCNLDKERFSIRENGSDSDSFIESSYNFTDTYISQNNVDVLTKVNTVINTGNNKIIGNNSGEANVATGNVSFSASIKNDHLNKSLINLSHRSSKSDPNVEIPDNASGSLNKLFYFTNSKNQFFIENDSTIFNEVVLDVETGSNIISGNMGSAKIKTGSILVDIILRNNYINRNFVNISCCGDLPNNPSEPDDPDKPQDNSSEPDHPINPNQNNNSHSNSQISFGDIRSFSQTGNGGAEVLGLSNTFGGRKMDLIFLFGFLLMFVGSLFLIDSFREIARGDEKLSF